MARSIALLIGDDPSLNESVQKVIRPNRMLQLEVVSQLADARGHLPRQEVVVLLVHLRPTDEPEEVTEFLRELADSGRQIPALVLGDDYRNDHALAVLRAGASDYVGVPRDLGKLAYFLHAASVCTTGKATPSGNDPFFCVLSPEMVEMMDQVRRAAAQDTTLLLTGETGTGKTCLARLIHKLSSRRDQPFLVVDCGALSENLIESEIFGHHKGAFTGADRNREGKFAAVGRGTLFLDEVNALSPALQSKLLRAVEDRIYEPVGSNVSNRLEARIIAAANTSLEKEVAAGRFRQDLYFRLNVVGFYLPPLRDRRGAIQLLVNKFLAELTVRNNRDLSGLSPQAWQLFTDYDWPGNIRQLRNAVERAVLLTSGPQIQACDLPEALRELAGSGRQTLTRPCETAPPAIPLNQTREDVEIRQIKAALAKHANNRLRAASELGISRMALYGKLHKYDLLNFGSRGSRRVGAS